MNRQNKEAGFNLIEAAIVLGIVGLVVAGIWAAASAAYENMRQQSVSKNLLAFAQNIKNFYANSGLATLPANAITPAALINNGVAPREFISGTRLIHPWGTPPASAATSNVRVTNGSVAGTFVIRFDPGGNLGTGTWRRVCNNLITRNANASTGSGMTWCITGSGTCAGTTPVTANPNCTDTSVPSFQFPIQG